MSAMLPYLGVSPQHTLLQNRSTIVTIIFLMPVEDMTPVQASAALGRLRARFGTAGVEALARIWTYVRDERPWASNAPPAAWYQFSADREGKHPTGHLSNYTGWMHADGYSGFNRLYEKGRVNEIACMAHVRRKFVDIFKGSGLQVAEEAIKRIALLYAIEKAVRGKSPEERALAR